MEAFKKECQERGLRLEVRMNEKGRIYGATFVTDEIGIAMNGSRLGKRFSANALNERFGEEEKIPELQPQLEEEKQTEEVLSTSIMEGLLSMGSDDGEYKHRADDAWKESINRKRRKKGV